ncbi:peroxide stress protein YaaA [Corynebacterium resistens]
MLIVLPPSETKSVGGDGAPLNFADLSFPLLNSTRESIAHDLAALDDSQAMAALGISEKLRVEAAHNRALFDSPTQPAILRYTGVLYDALDVPSLPPSAWRNLAIGSALFGVVMAADPIPHYRLSGTVKLPPSNDTLKKRWGSQITDTLASYQDKAGGPIVDLRSGTYQQLGKLPGAITVRVESEQTDGSRKVVSHFNKHYKGLVARELATCGSTPRAINDIASILANAGMRVELPGDSARGSKITELTLVVSQH